MLKEEQLLKAFELLSNAGIDDEILGRLMRSDDEIKEQAKNELLEEIKANDEDVKTTEEIDPEFILESDQTFTFKIDLPDGFRAIGGQEIEKTIHLRVLQNSDYDRLIAQIPHILGYLRKRNVNFLRGSKNSQEYVKKIDPMVFIQDLLYFGFTDRHNGKPTILNTWIYEEASRLLSDSKTAITPGYLKSLDHYDQIISSLLKLAVLNKRFLFRFLDLLPSDLSQMIYTLIGKIMSTKEIMRDSLKEIQKSISTIEDSLGGGIEDGTGLGSLPHSQKSSDLKKPLKQSYQTHGATRSLDQSLKRNKTTYSKTGNGKESLKPA